VWCKHEIHPMLIQETQTYRGHRAEVRKRLAMNLGKHIVWVDEKGQRVCFKCPTSDHSPI
jgi:hypothetical protein